jgi:hypothetical protein
MKAAAVRVSLDLNVPEILREAGPEVRRSFLFYRDTIVFIIKNKGLARHRDHRKIWL